MSNIPQELKYTKTHEWVKIENQHVVVGITDFAQHQLSDITYIEFPEIGKHVEAGKEVVVVESIKAASDVYAPVAGTVTETNTALANSPEVVNTDPFRKGWLFKMEPDNLKDVEVLLDAAAYQAALPADY